MSDNALHTAAKAGNVAEVQSQVGKFDINAKGEYGETALFKAAESGHTDVVKLLETHNADVNLASVSISTIDFDPSDINFTIFVSILHSPLHLLEYSLVSRIVAPTSPSTNEHVVQYFPFL